jgi:hypothetical protein
MFDGDLRIKIFQPATGFIEIPAQLASQAWGRNEWKFITAVKILVELARHQGKTVLEVQPVKRVWVQVKLYFKARQ